mmetsp:Transcript_12622/g.21121  ORF Transcript_12622/g.21121 Transcript_12622/m.21121 type:complete len:219 (-) Transcript_12622:778-1434(-)
MRFMERGVCPGSISKYPAGSWRLLRSRNTIGPVAREPTTSSKARCALSLWSFCTRQRSLACILVVFTVVGEDVCRRLLVPLLMEPWGDTSLPLLREPVGDTSLPLLPPAPMPPVGLPPSLGLIIAGELARELFREGDDIIRALVGAASSEPSIDALLPFKLPPMLPPAPLVRLEGEHIKRPEAPPVLTLPSCCIPSSKNKIPDAFGEDSKLPFFELFK